MAFGPLFTFLFSQVRVRVVITQTRAVFVALSANWRKIYISGIRHTEKSAGFPPEESPFRLPPPQKQNSP